MNPKSRKKLTPGSGITDFEIDFAKKYDQGTVVEVIITQIIPPTQIITDFFNGFTGRLSVFDMSFCVPEGREKFKNYKIGDRITCIVRDVDFKNKQVKLSQKVFQVHYTELSNRGRNVNDLATQLSDNIKWERIQRGDEFQGEIIETLNDFYLIKTTKGWFGLLHKSLMKESLDNLKVKVNSKLDNSDLLSFVPASMEIGNDSDIQSEQVNEFSFIDEELQSLNNFKRSPLADQATDEQFTVIQQGFGIDDNIFSKEISTPHILYIHFERNSSVYEITLRQNAIPFFYGTQYTEELEKKLLDKLSKESYWFRMNERPNKNKKNENDEKKYEFTLYNENISFHGFIQISKDHKEYHFLIINLTFGHTVSTSSEAKKKNTKKGSFLFSNQLKVLSPFDALPFGNSQKSFFDYALLKTQCFEIVNKLRLNGSEILKKEGKTLGIIDRFLEYQIWQLNSQKGNNVFVEKFERIPSPSGGVAIKLPVSVANSLEIEEETVVNVKVAVSVGEPDKVGEGRLSYCLDQGGCKIAFEKINLDLLKDGFYIEKKISKRQFTIQREIIKDFLAKKIRIDHIESLLVNPENIKTPALADVTFFNKDLQKAEIEPADNNQVKAVKKAIGNQNVFLIQGPPGTGKTTIIAEIIQQLVARGEKILVVGQNHVAVDNVLERIAGIHHLNILRVGKPERINKDLVQFSIDNLVESYKEDYGKFMLNQLNLSNLYYELKEADVERKTFLELYKEEVNRLCAQYGKLKDAFKQRHFILRQGLDQLSTDEIPFAISSLQEWIADNLTDYEIILKPLIYGSRDVVFATCIGIKTDLVLQDDKFDVVIIDEAGKANIAESLVAIGLGEKVILVGDQKQLPPYMDSSLLDENDPNSFPRSQFGDGYKRKDIIHALQTSFFEFIIDRISEGRFPEENKEMLNYQHRMHPNIGQFISDSFYDGEVQMGSRTHENRLDLPAPFNKEVVFFDTSNLDNPYEQTDGNSVRNIVEAKTISEVILPQLFEHNISPGSIAIVAPYKSQVANIEHHIRNSTVCNFKNIDISTLDSFQGMEFDIIIFSFTRSSNHRKALEVDGKKKYVKVGFLDDARRLNVAFSRAKKKLILVGNAVTLTDNRSHYYGFYDYANLFRNLVEHSKKETIGNFVNLAHLHEFKLPFAIFSEKYKPGERVTGRTDSIGIKENNIIFGLFVEIDNVKCLFPASLMPRAFRAKLDSLTLNEDIEVIIADINREKKQVTVKFPYEEKIVKRKVSWDAAISGIRRGDRVRGVVINMERYGYFIMLDCGLSGLLHNTKIRREIDLQKGQEVMVTIVNIDYNKEKIDLGL